GVVPQRSPRPILTNVFLETKGNKLILFGTDFDQSIIGEIELIDVTDEGGVGVSGKRFFDLLRELSGDKVNLKKEGRKLILREIGGGGKFSFPIVTEEDFPSRPKIEEEKARIKMKSAQVQRMLSRTSYATSADISLVSFTGVLWQIKPDEYRTVATDGHRLAIAIEKEQLSSPLTLDLLIPKRSVEQLMKLLAKTDVKEFEIIIDEGKVFFIVGPFTFQTSLIAERFPNYEQVIPRDNDKVLVLKRDDLVQALRRVGLFTSTLTHLVRFTMGENGLRLKAVDPESGEAEEVLEATYNGEPLEIGFNSNDIIEILRHIETESVKFSFRTPMTACMIAPIDEETNYFTIVMPLRLPEEF
ncbi:MAG: DNA polymerase III subunit beta, partial [bacterium]